MLSHALKHPVHGNARRLFIVACLTTALGCSQKQPSQIDASKVIDMTAPTLFAMRITLFTYEQADERGWPSSVKAQRYVRFLQDKGIRVGFWRDEAGEVFVAMTDVTDTEAVISADREAASAGIAKPPMTPDSAPN